MRMKIGKKSKGKRGKGSAGGGSYKYPKVEISEAVIHKLDWIAMDIERESDRLRTGYIDELPNLHKSLSKLSEQLRDVTDKLLNKVGL